MWLIDGIFGYWQIVLVSFVAGMFFVWLATKVFPKLGLMDRPERYGLPRKPIPYYGGLAVFVAFVVVVFIFVPFTKSVIGLLTGATILVALGFIDDYRGLSPWVRLSVQFLAAVILVVSGIGVLSFNMPGVGVVDLTQWMWGAIPVLGALFTIFWIMALVNAMNFVDGVSGLSSGVAFFAGLTLFFLSIRPSVHADVDGQSVVAVLSLILAMVSLAFLIFDFPKSRILMGDTGSTFLGFLIATLAIFSGGKVATAVLVLGIPILDMLWVILRRLKNGGKFWKGDLDHLHHKLLRLGLSERRVVVLYLAVTAVLGFLAVSFVDGEQKLFMFFALLLLMLILAVLLVRHPQNLKEEK